MHDGAIVGLGSGSTATDVLRLIGERVRTGLKIRGIATSRKTGELATSLGIPLTGFDQVQEIDVTVDGADEFDRRLSLIKMQRIVAGACNHPNLLVLPFGFELVRPAA